MKLSSRILISFMATIGFLGGATAFFSYHLVEKYVVQRTQDQVIADLRTVDAMIKNPLERMETMFLMVRPDEDLDQFKKMAGLDYLYLVKAEELPRVRSGIVNRVMRTKTQTGGYRLVEKDELIDFGSKYQEQALIPVRMTPKATKSEKTVLDSAMSMEYAKPFFNDSGEVESVLYGGKIMNRYFQFIDDIVGAVFENKLYDNKPLGTLTIFLDDVRIATNVLDDRGQRAIGTRVSKEVYERVVVQGGSWFDRAFVVTDWYLTAYEPIRDIDGQIIGILYVGILEKPFKDLQARTFFAFAMMILAASVMAIFISWFLSRSLAKPMTEMVKTIRKIENGELESQVEVKTSLKEINELTRSFNEMAGKLAERERSLAVSNEKLTSLNKRYLDMIGFVSHELSGILNTAVFSVYSLSQEMLGEINLKQKQVLDTLAKSLDYLSTMVRNFLSLSRVEKGELALQKTPVYLNENIVEESLAAFKARVSERGMKIVNQIPAQLQVLADPDMIKIVVNNLVTNAIKYGVEKGSIIMSARVQEERVEVEFYNDGEPITDDEREKLFKRFSRLQNVQGKGKGTGLGLFITKEIIEAHRGRIWLETKPFGNAFVFTLEKGKMNS
ncbi:MAG: cache domain-containing protein [Candidatus Omnitrophica bacterium]|nr:cache domain-containing protein [Candidatus Omnitrophota bacterium]